MENLSILQTQDIWITLLIILVWVIFVWYIIKFFFKFNETLLKNKFLPTESNKADLLIESIHTKLDKIQKDLDGLSENIIALELFELNHHLNMAVANENFEEAQRLKDVIDDIKSLINKKNG